jgi:sugar lactone lactonase YvrE
MEPEIVADHRCHTGENPLWHPMEKNLYWTDIPRGRLYRYDPATGKSGQCFEGAPVGGFTVQVDGALLLFMARGAVARWSGGNLDFIVREIEAEKGNRFNDVIADPSGRVFCGTMGDKKGSGRLYRLDADGSIHVMLEGIGVSNGMGFTPDRRHMYYTDSAYRRIYLFDYEGESGTIANQRIWLTTPENEGSPDGLTVDAGGFVWSARWNGSAVYRYSPGGTEDRRIAFPALKVSSVCFGGDELSDLYVTTALGDGEREKEGAGAGALFRLRSRVRGVPEFFSRIGIE